MKAIHVSSFGGAEVLKVMEAASPLVDKQQVLIAVKAAGVGTVDVMFRKGIYPGVSQPGFIPGIEVAGIVVDAGGEVDRKWLNQRVFAIVPGGGYAEEVVVSVSSLILIPGELSFIHAVGLGVNALVAHFSLRRAALRGTETLLLRGAGGGIGMMTVQLALQQKIKVTAETSSPKKRKKIEGMGAKLFAGIEAPENDTFDAIIDPVAGTHLDPYVNLLRENGSYLLIGAAAGFPSADFGISWLSRFQKSLSFSCVSLSAVDQKALQEAMTAIFHMAIDGGLTPFVDHQFKLEEAAQAHEYLESGSTFGKNVLVI